MLHKVKLCMSNEKNLQYELCMVQSTKRYNAESENSSSGQCTHQYYHLKTMITVLWTARSVVCNVNVQTALKIPLQFGADDKQQANWLKQR